ncbi:MAG: DUF2927 domain-containing protein [Polyangiaceae bacterium]
MRAWVCLALVALGCSGSTDHAAPLDGGGSGAVGATSGGGNGAGAGTGSVGGAAGQGGGAGQGGAAAAPAREDVRAWVKEVTLGPEFGGSGKVCSRWATSPTLSVMQGDASVRQDLVDLVPILNGLLANSGTQLELVTDQNDAADIKVYYAPLASFDSIAANNGFPYVQGNWGYFYTFWNGAHEITRGYVMLATDKLSGDTLRHFTFEEVTQVLGLSNDSAYFADSIFYANGANGGSATELSALDEQLVTFFYSHVQPGDTEPGLDAAFDAYFP